MSEREFVVAAYPPMIFHPDIHMSTDKEIICRFCFDFGLNVDKVYDCILGKQKTHYGWRFEIKPKSPHPPTWMNYLEYGKDGLITEVEE
jgi:hypothetical protein